MPFCPTTIERFAHKSFKNLEKAKTTSKYMNISFGCTEKMKTECPGVVHVDGTARPQILSKDDNHSFYCVINEFRKITGHATLLNTSFNMHEEPIVCTPQDAIDSFIKTKLDYLAIGSYLVKN